VLTFYIGMMAFMCLGQQIAVALDNSYAAVVYGSIIGNLVCILLAYAWRSLRRLNHVNAVAIR
jgi:hypothetical protein